MIISYTVNRTRLAHRQFVRLIAQQPGYIVRILVPTGQAKDPLPQQILHRVPPLLSVEAR